MAVKREAPMTQLTLFPDPKSADPGNQPVDRRSPLAQMVDRLDARLRAAGIRFLEWDPSHTRLPMLIVRIPVPPKPRSLSERRFELSDAELGKWWNDHVRYQISYEPFADGTPGFTLIDKRDDFVVWARSGKHPCMMFRDWPGAVRAAIAREESRNGD